jgi:hypothetical protein
MVKKASFIEICNEGCLPFNCAWTENVLVGCVVLQSQMKHVGNIFFLSLSANWKWDSALIICAEEEMILTAEDSARFSILIIFISIVDSEYK